MISIRATDKYSSSRLTRKQHATQTPVFAVSTVFNRTCRARDIELPGFTVITGDIKGMKITRGIIYRVAQEYFQSRIMDCVS